MRIGRLVNKAIRPLGVSVHRHHHFSDPSDTFLGWLEFINPGMLMRNNVALFGYCIDRLPSAAPIVEIGSFAGRSLNTINHLLRRSNRPNPVFSVDAWTFEGAQRDGVIPGSQVTYAAYREHVIDTFRRNVTLFSGDRLPHHMELQSDPFFEQWSKKATVVDFFGREVALGGPIAMAYIDGAHTYEQATQDFKNIDSHLEPGGFVIFDDSSDSGPFGSSQAARDAADDARYRLVGKNPNYCLQKRH